MNALASALVIIAAVAANLISDIVIRPKSPVLADDWNWTCVVVFVVGVIGFFRAINKEKEKS